MKLRFYKKSGQSVIRESEDDVALDATDLDFEDAKADAPEKENCFRSERGEEKEPLLVLPPDDGFDEMAEPEAPAEPAPRIVLPEPAHEPVGVDPMRAEHSFRPLQQSTENDLGFSKPLKVAGKIEKDPVPAMGDPDPVRAPVPAPASAPTPARLRIRRPSRKGEPEFERKKGPGIETLFGVDMRQLSYVGGAVFFVIMGIMIATSLFGDAGSSEEKAPEFVSQKQHIIARSDGLRDELVGKAMAFLRASSVEEKLNFLRKPSREVEAVERFYAGRETLVESFEEITYSGLVDVDDSPKYVLHALLEDGTKRLLVFLDGPDGMRIDWPCFARTNERDWRHFLKSKSTDPADFRVVVHPDSYFNFHFEDNRHWACYRLRNLDEEGDLFGYVPAGSDLHRRLRGLFRGQPARLLILEVAYPDNAAGRDQVEILGLTAVGWVKD